MPKTQPLRVIQWATGNIGKRSLQRVIEHPDMELVDLTSFIHPDLRTSAVNRGALTLWTHRHNTDAMFLSVLRKKN